jgi:ABC-type nitrate/sulfonate/bicarbonate transport system substrate-binding protein
MLLKILSAVILLLSVPLGLSAQERHYVSYGGTAGFQATVWAMKDLGTFEKYGLNGDVVLVGGSARQIQGVLGGSTDFAQVDITAVVSANLKGADLVVVGGTMNKLPFSMVTQPEIREPSQLRGKKIGVVNFGGANEYAVLAALNEWGIPASATTIMPAGGAATRLTAMSAKVLDATVLSPPETIKADKLGLRTLLHLSELKASFPMNVVIVRRPYLEKNREVVKRFMKAHADAVYQLKHDKKRAIEILQHRLLQKEKDVIEGTYNYYAPKFEFPPRVNREGAAATAKFVIDRVAGGKASIDVTKLIDENILDELDREGFFKTFGK